MHSALNKKLIGPMKESHTKDEFLQIFSEMEQGARRLKWAAKPAQTHARKNGGVFGGGRSRWGPSTT
jgi:hypothetical protein